MGGPSSIVMASTALLNEKRTAVQVANTIMNLTFLANGFWANISSIPWALRWLAYISPQRYTAMSLMINENIGVIETQFINGTDPCEYEKMFYLQREYFDFSEDFLSYITVLKYCAY